MTIEREYVKSLLYGRARNRRFTQDSPILPEVWMDYGEHPDRPLDLLLTPYQAPAGQSRTPAELASALDELLHNKNARSEGYRRSVEKPHDIAANQTTVAVRLYFDELVRVVLPLSSWWQSRSLNPQVGTKSEPALRLIERLFAEPSPKSKAEKLASWRAKRPLDIPENLYWLVVIVSEIYLSNVGEHGAAEKSSASHETPENPVDFVRRILAVENLTKGAALAPPATPFIHLVSRNRPAFTCLHRSVAAVKGDAAVNLFKIDCADVTWAIADSGIDARHPAFRRRDPRGELLALGDNWAAQTRIAATYDFTLIRHILGATEDVDAALPKNVQDLLDRDPNCRKEIRRRLLGGRQIDWPLLLPFITVPHDGSYTAPAHDHGTHVAGIVGADWRPDEDPEGRLDTPLRGMCPNVNLIDLRILDEQGYGDEFSIMAALQFLRYLNSHKDFMAVHGVNLSLSIRHDVANYACGRTPICEECERLVAEGIVVVAAAGNEGFSRQTTSATGSEYQSISITDPGNTACVITVGSTHRDMPHTYGVSYFSSRGPTGDGRLKPDLVAPGEKIDSTAPGEGLVRKDGTSMATPHVSGAAALLLARHREFIRQPERIKQVLCESATDLGRERYFQGCGMLDVLRALQSV